MNPHRHFILLADENVKKSDDNTSLDRTNGKEITDHGSPKQ